MPTESNPPAVLTLALLEDSEHEAEISCTELESLLTGLGYSIEARVTARRRRSHKLLGEGALADLRERIAALAPREVSLFVDASLEPGLQRELARILEVEVHDRTSVVLQVFESRAKTRLAKLEIELARLAYEVPRLRDQASGDDRQGGGGRGGRGHTNVELSRQAMRARRVEIERELAKLREVRSTQVARRQAVPRVALVGYTNAGKSSLLRALTGSEVVVEDALFVTLEATVRALVPATSPRILLSDTVGFMRNLPHELIGSFHSTLDEARDAELLLLVVDASDPEHREQLRITEQTLQSLEVTAPRRIVLNKADRLTEEEAAALRAEFPQAWWCSTRDPERVRALHARIDAFFHREDEADVLSVPFEYGALLAEIRAHAQVLEERYLEHGAVLTVRAAKSALVGWRAQLPPRETIASPQALLAQAARYGLALSSEAHDFDASGLDFRVVYADDESGRPWIVRQPLRADVSEGAQREARVLRMVRDALPVAVPDWQLHTQELIAYPKLEGVPLWTQMTAEGVTWKLPLEELPVAFYRSLAELFVAMQSIDASVAEEHGVQVTGLASLRQELRQHAARAREVLSPSPTVWARWQAWLERSTGWPEHVALAHGDLHPGHLLLDDEARVIGVLDWTEAQLTDPSVDLALFLGCLGADSLTRFLVEFERLGGRTWPGMLEHAQERWAFYPVLVTIWALDHGHPAALEHAKQLLAAVTAQTDARLAEG